MSGAPAISVVIPARDGARDVAALRACLEAQTLAASAFEALVVDDGSVDATPDLLGRWREAWARDGRTLRVLGAATSEGSYAARNRGVRAARAPVLAFTDVDCRPDPLWLEALLDALHERGLDLAAGPIRALPGGGLLEAFAARRGVLSQEAALAHPFRPFAQTANLALHRRVLEDVGLFRAALRSGGDADLCWRAQARGFRLGLAPGAIVGHRHRDRLGSLYAQFRGYGRSARWLHELHGAPYDGGLRAVAVARILGGWALRAPVAIGRRLAGRCSTLDVVEVPLAVLCGVARRRGVVAGAALPEGAGAIEPLRPAGAEVRA